MSGTKTKHLYLPSKDRSFWKDEGGLPLSYLAWGRRDFDDDRIPVSEHEGWVCTVIEEGRPTLLLNDKKVSLSPGEIVFIGPECAFGWEGKQDVEYKFCMWMWNHINSPKLRSHQHSYTTRLLPLKKREPFLQLHEQCRREVLNLDDYSSTYLEGCHIQFEALLERTLEAKQEDDKASARIEQATAWMNEHLDSREPIARLCDYLNLSQSSLHRLFKSRMSTSPANHFHALKMEHAKELLQNEDMQVKEIAFQLGYDHFNDFSRAYKKHFGRAPTDQ